MKVKLGGFTLSIENHEAQRVTGLAQRLSKIEAIVADGITPHLERLDIFKVSVAHWEADALAQDSRLALLEKGRE